MLRMCWQYRSFIKSSIINDVRVRFSRSMFGGLWVLLQPLAQAAIFALVLSVFMQARLPGIPDTSAYAAYLLSGMLCWTLFMESMQKGVNLFIENAHLIKKMRFPLATLPIVSGGVALLNNFFLLGATLAILVILGFIPSEKVLLIPALIAATMLLGLSVGMLLGVINVFVRDVGVAVPIFLQFFFWLCPIVYSPEMMPQNFQEMMLLNPVAGLVQAYQGVLVFDSYPEASVVIVPLIITVVSVGLMFFFLRRTYSYLMDLL